MSWRYCPNCGQELPHETPKDVVEEPKLSPEEELAERDRKLRESRGVVPVFDGVVDTEVQ